MAGATVTKGSPSRRAVARGSEVKSPTGAARRRPPRGPRARAPLAATGPAANVPPVAGAAPGGMLVVIPNELIPQLRAEIARQVAEMRPKQEFQVDSDYIVRNARAQDTAAPPPTTELDRYSMALMALDEQIAQFGEVLRPICSGPVTVAPPVEASGTALECLNGRLRSAISRLADLRNSVVL